MPTSVCVFCPICLHCPGLFFKLSADRAGKVVFGFIVLFFSRTLVLMNLKRLY